MRKLIVTRGLPGSGKSSLLARLGLADFTLSADQLRLQFSSPILGPDGRMTIDQGQNGKVWPELIRLLAERMAQGQTVVVDALHVKGEDFAPYLKLARDHRYEIACLDLSGVSLEAALARNARRAPWRQLPEYAIRTYAEKLCASKIPDGVGRIDALSPTVGGDLASFLSVPELDLSRSRRVVHVGDIQGCATALTELVAHLGGIQSDDTWIFVGDICDRGPENGQALRWMMEALDRHSNILVLHGNHEDHLYRQSRGHPPVSSEFADRTLPQLRHAGISDRDLDDFCGHLFDVVRYRRGDRRVIVTHAGLPGMPPDLWMVPSRQFAHGCGRYEDNVDARWETGAPLGLEQVHGHRNHHALPVLAAGGSINLEDGVEHGGHMRAAVLDDAGWHPVALPNRVFTPFRRRRHRDMDIVPPWMEKGTKEGGTLIDPGLRQALETHKGVNVYRMASFPHVVSYAFKKQVFHDRAWDEVVVKARGLFIDQETGEIVSRGYEKFFNEGEFDSHSPEALREKLVFPLTLWVKENGYLGLLGYDRRTDRLFASSKSQAEGDFAEWFREILAETIPDAGRIERLRRFLRDTESAMTFEVIDPVRDPHIVSYPKRGLVLLDMVRRSTNFELLPYAPLQKVGKEFGFEVKRRAMRFETWKAYEGWLHSATRDMSKQIEGYVCEDATGFMFKVKLPYYSFWKSMRWVKDTVGKEKEFGQRNGKLDHIQGAMESRDLGFLVEQARDFRDWCREQPRDALRASVIDLRTAFEARVMVRADPEIEASRIP